MRPPTSRSTPQVLGAVVALPHAALHKVPEAGGFDEESAALNAPIPAASIVA